MCNVAKVNSAIKLLFSWCICRCLSTLSGRLDDTIKLINMLHILVQRPSSFPRQLVAQSQTVPAANHPHLMKQLFSSAN